MIRELFQDEPNMTAAERKRETLVVQLVLITVLMLVFAYALGNYTGTKEASQHCAAGVAAEVSR